LGEAKFHYKIKREREAEREREGGKERGREMFAFLEK
jgi:hypothetical protein